MYVDVEANENIHENFSMLYRDVSVSREIYCIKYNIEGEESPVQVIGWDKETQSPCAAYACHFEESGDGIATLIHGGEVPVEFESNRWKMRQSGNLENPNKREPPTLFTHETVL